MLILQRILLFSRRNANCPRGQFKLLDCYQVSVPLALLLAILFGLGLVRLCPQAAPASFSVKGKSEPLRAHVIAH